jgi:flavodoxin
VHMKTLIIYDSLYGNTEKIAFAIGQAIEAEAMVKKVSEARVEDLEEVGLFIVGSPTHGGRATPAVQEFLKKIPNGTLRNAKVAAFDTRMEENDRSFFMRFIIKIFNFAAPKMAENLKIKGVEKVIEPMGFIVEGKEGPLKQGELERAARWAKGLL